MEKNIKIVSNDDSVIIKIYNADGLEFIILAIGVYIFFLICSLLIPSIDLSFFKGICIFFIIVESLSMLIFQFSYNAFEKIIIERNKIILKFYFLPFYLNFRTIILNNNDDLNIFFNDTSERRGCTGITGMLHERFYIFKRYSPKRRYEIFYLLFPNLVRGFRFKRNKKEYSFGCMMVKEDYDEILDIILKQRKKWKQENDKINEDSDENIEMYVL
jgi:hypothetical protein